MGAWGANVGLGLDGWKQEIRDFREGIYGHM